jgi:hypothetical protein
VSDSPANLRDAAQVVAIFRHAAQAMRHSPVRQHCVVKLLPPLGGDKGRLLITGDLHDNPTHLHKIIRLAQLGASPHHHVVLQEIIHGEKLINGMDFSYRMLARVAELLVRFPDQVHLLLANHELSQLTGAGVSKGAGNSVEIFNDGLEFVFGDDAEEVSDAVKELIAALPLALITESGVLCAHSVPSPHAMKFFDCNIFDRDLTPADYRAPSGMAYLMVWGRGHTGQQLDQLAERWNVKLFCLGHEHVETGIEIKGPRHVVLNSDHDRAVVVPIDLAHAPSTQEIMLSAIPLAAIGE